MCCRSPGFALALVAESTSGCLISAELAAAPSTALTSAATETDSAPSATATDKDKDSDDKNGVLAMATDGDEQEGEGDAEIETEDGDSKERKTKPQSTTKADSDKAEKTITTSAESLASSTPLPEDLGRLVASQLCEEISQGGVVDSGQQTLMLLLMLLGPEDVSKIRLGKLTPYTYALPPSVFALSQCVLLQHRLSAAVS